MNEGNALLEDDEATVPDELTDDEILSAIAGEETRAYGYLSGELAEQRAQALDYFYGEDYGNEEEGRSQVKTTELSDVIESVMPTLMKVFAGGEQVVKFSPRNAEDVKQAEQESDYLNWLVLEKNNGFNVIYNWFKDALIQKNGYVISAWEETKVATEETYQGLRDEELAFLAQDPSIEVLEYSARQVQELDGIATVHDVKISKTDEDGELKIYNIPPEEMLVSLDCPSPNPKDANFVQWRTLRTISEIRELGYDVADDVADEENYLLSQEANARNQSDESMFDLEGADPSTRRVVFKRSWVRMDLNNDGIAELLYICHIGNTILHKDTVAIIPVSCITPIPVPHRHIGRSYADLVMDLQLQKSTMLRQIFDNMYLANNARTAIDADNVNLDDLLTNTAGGVVRTIGSPSASIMPLIAPQVAGAGFQMLEYIDTLVEVKTGVTKYNQGMDANSLNKTASGISQIMSAAQARIELVSRVFAETGVKDLFQTVHSIVQKHAKKADIVQLRNEWIPIDPRQWSKRTYMVVTVGIGTGNKDQQLGHIMQILNVMKEAMAGGVPIVTPDNLYNAVIELTKNAGFKDADKFWTNPSKMPPKQPQPDPEQIKLQGQMQMEQMKLQADQQKFQATSQIEQEKAQMQLQQEQLRSQNDVAIEQEKIKAQMELERWKAQLQADVELKKAQLEIESKMALANQEQTMQLNGIIEQAKMAKGDESMRALVEGLGAVIQTIGKPKSIVRDENGRVAGVQ